MLYHNKKIGLRSSSALNSLPHHGRRSVGRLAWLGLKFVLFDASRRRRNLTSSSSSSWFPHTSRTSLPGWPTAARCTSRRQVDQHVELSRLCLHTTCQRKKNRPGRYWRGYDKQLLTQMIATRAPHKTGPFWMSTSTQTFHLWWSGVTLFESEGKRQS